MKQVKIADLKNNLSRHLAHVRAGGDLVVLDRSTPVARVIPFDRPFDRPRGHRGAAGEARAARQDDWAPDRLAEMERRGILTRGGSGTIAAWLKTARPAKLPPGTPSAVGLLLRARRESTR